jgi:hypothetical protein
MKIFISNRNKRKSHHIPWVSLVVVFTKHSPEAVLASTQPSPSFHTAKIHYYYYYFYKTKGSAAIAFLHMLVGWHHKALLTKEMDWKTAPAA